MWHTYIRSRLPPLEVSPDREIEIVEELAGQLEAVYDAALAAGATPREARERAEQEITDWPAFAAAVAPTRPPSPPATSVPLWGRRSPRGTGVTAPGTPVLATLPGLAHDARYGVRVLSRSRAYSAVAILTLAVAIAVATTVLSLARAWWLTPLPYAQPEQLTMVWATNLKVGQPRDVMSGPTFLDLQRRTASFEGLAAFAVTDLTVRAADGADLVSRLEVTPEFFDVLSLAPAAGRTFTSNDGLAGTSGVALLGHAFWQRRFGGDPAVIGRSLSELGHPHVVIGILPERFGLLEPPDVVTLLRPEDLAGDERTYYYYWVIGRLRAGVSAVTAERELDAIMQEIGAAFPEARGWETTVDRFDELASEPVRPALLTLLVAAGLVMVIATLNVSNLALGRTLERQAEMDVRSALGARLTRLVQQLGVETTLLVTAAGAAGLVLAIWLIPALSTLLPPVVALRGSAATLPLPAPRLDLAVIFSAIVLTGLIALMLFLVQAAALRRRLATDGFAERRAIGHPRMRRDRAALIAGQAALATALLIAAGLLSHTIVRMVRADPGFRPDGVVSLIVGRVHDLDAGERARYYTELLSRVSFLPGVTAAALNDYVLLTNEDDYEGLTIEGRPPPPPGQGYREEWRRVSPAYFSAMATPIVRGRGFTEQDTDASPSVVIVNQAMAAKYWPDDDPVGRRIRVHASRYGWSEIVGVAGDVREVGLDRPAKPMFFVPYHRDPRPVMGLFVRATETPEVMIPAIRRAVAAVDPTRPVSNVATLSRIVSNSYAVKRTLLWVAASLAMLAAMMTAAGIYSVVRMAAAQRTREIGVRMALGARAGAVRWLVVRQGVVPSLMGLVLGLALARAGTRFLEAELYEVSPSDPATYLAVIVLVAITTGLASLIPARRATRVDPVQALRTEE